MSASPKSTKRINKRRPVADRFWEKVSKHLGGCWEWIACRNGRGYGKFYNDRHVYAHRWAYEQDNGPIPDGLTIDHLCKNTSCVRPDHMEAVTQRVNVLRGESPSAQCARKTHCKRGHPFDGKNTYTSPTGRRQCLVCNRERDKRRYYARKAKSLT